MDDIRTFQRMEPDRSVLSGGNCGPYAEMKDIDDEMDSRGRIGKTGPGPVIIEKS